jgi:hypothetical protein
MGFNITNITSLSFSGLGGASGLDGLFNEIMQALQGGQQGQSGQDPRKLAHELKKLAKELQSVDPQLAQALMNEAQNLDQGQGSDPTGGSGGSDPTGGSGGSDPTGGAGGSGPGGTQGPGGSQGAGGSQGPGGPGSGPMSNNPEQLIGDLLQAGLQLLQSDPSLGMKAIREALKLAQELGQQFDPQNLSGMGGTDPFSSLMSDPSSVATALLAQNSALTG